MGADLGREESRCSLIVGGFMRGTDLTQTIPTAIYEICFRFYFVQESFDPEFCGDTYQLSENNTKIEKLTNGRTSAYLTKVVDKGIHKWQFKINKMQYNIVIGIWKNKYTKSSSQDIYYTFARGKYYGWNVYTTTTTSGEDEWCTFYGDYSGKQGDIIDMIFDLDKYHLKFNVNGQSQGRIFQDQIIEPCEYIVGILIEKKGDSLQLLSYKSSF